MTKPKKIKTYYALLIATLLFWGACKEDVELLTFSYSTTLCSDPWWPHCTEATGSEFNDCIRTFIESQGIEIESLDRRLFDPNPIPCEACGCMSGWGVVVKAKSIYSVELELLGFAK
ncbi:MAG: hypothetical protein AAFW73_05225 [Bacteroidota bacterium]